MDTSSTPTSARESGQRTDCREEPQRHTWSALLEGYVDRLQSHGCREFVEGFSVLQLRRLPDSIPALSERLRGLCGWQVASVHGLLPARAFFDLLSRKVYPVVGHMRSPDELAFSKAPDLFHDVLGHLPMLTNPSYARFLEHYATVAARHLDCPQVLRELGRLYWHTMETGLILEGGREKVFGAAIMTSRAEFEHARSPSTHKHAMDPEVVLATDFDNFQLQPRYFVIESFDSLIGLAAGLAERAEVITSRTNPSRCALGHVKDGVASRGSPTHQAPSKVVCSPNMFLVEDYVPGFTIDFREPAAETDVERLRQSFDAGSFFADCSDDEAMALKLGKALVELGITDSDLDLRDSLFAYTGATLFRDQLRLALEALGVHSPPSEPASAVGLLLDRTNSLVRSDYPMQLYCHIPGGVTELQAGSTHYGYVIRGMCLAHEARRTVPIPSNAFFSIAGEATLSGDGECIVITRLNYLGLTLYGNELEPWGRLQYIDGCTDTLLVAPVKKGDPCLNALYFPPSTEQTAHVHPSVRCGVVVAGEGVCKTLHGDFSLRPGKVFFLPPETYHSFHTRSEPGAGRSALTVLAFHPDSDFGPTDTDHPMVNRTYFRFLHRLKSSQA